MPSRDAVSPGFRIELARAFTIVAQDAGAPPAALLALRAVLLALARALALADSASAYGTSPFRM